MVQIVHHGGRPVSTFHALCSVFLCLVFFVGGIPNAYRLHAYFAVFDLYIIGEIGVYCSAYCVNIEGKESGAWYITQCT